MRNSLLNLPGLIVFVVSVAVAGWGHDAQAGMNSSNWFRMKPFRPEGYVCLKSGSPVIVDGKLDDAAWKRASWTRYFKDIEGSVKPNPRFKVRAKMLWDEQLFYIGAELEEPHVSATITQRDAVIFHDNDFEIFIDPDGDTHEYYEIEINALNTVWDLFLGKPYKDGGPAVNEWNISGLRTAVHVNGTLNNSKDKDVGWSVEFAFPWEELARYAHRSIPPKDGDQWRIDFSRVEWHYEIVDGKYQKVPNTKEDNWIWSPPGIIDMHRPEKWGYVQFSSRTTGPVAFRRDPAEGVRDALFEVYYLQRDYHEKNKTWAESLEKLGVSKKLVKRFQIQIHPTKEGYVASAKLTGPKPQLWKIRQDSKVWRDSSP